MKIRLLLVLACGPMLVACGTQPLKPSEGHLRAEPAREAAIPAPVTQVPPVPVPRPAPRTELYSVSVVNVPVQEILFALARDAKINVDIHPGISGNVTLNAIDQTLPQILDRVSRQVDMRYEIQGQTVAVMPDTPYLRHYRIDYVNMVRDATGTVAISTQIATPGAQMAAGGAAAAGGGVNTSLTSITNTARNRFWETLEKNVKDLLRETDKIIVEGPSEAAPAPAAAPRPAAPPAAPSGAAPQAAPAPYPTASEALSAPATRRVTFREAASVIANPETGVLTVRATSRQHEKVQEFLDRVLANAKRQVLIEATITEVRLSDTYQQGIDWSAFIKMGGKWTLAQTGRPFDALATPTTFVATYTGSDDFRAAIRALETFGTLKVLSSPRVSVLNNQTALLKVVDDRVYFTVKADTQQNQTTTVTTFTTTPYAVSVGLVMSVTPQIGEDDSVLLNMRPTVSRITGFVTDPNPTLTLAGVENRIPELQTREMESVLKVDSGQVAVMGGLMQDEVTRNDDVVPGISRIPLLGEFFTQRNDVLRKTELVIFIRPLVIRNAGMEGDFAGHRGFLPGEGFGMNPDLGPGYFDAAPATWGRLDRLRSQ